MRRENYPDEGLAILNFGCAYGDKSVRSYELENDQYKIISLGTVKNRVKNYILGYYSSASSDSIFLTIAVGINASVVPSEAHGENWSYMINDLNNWIINHDYQNRVYVVEAIDIETQWGPTPTQIQAWINAYHANTIYRAYDFGDALDCSRTEPPTEPQYQSPVNRLCRGSWYQDNVAHVSGSNNMFPLPEIYHTEGRDSDTWYRIDLYYYFDTGGKLDFHGSLTQYFACEQNWNPVTGDLSAEGIGANLTPATGYNQLKNKLYDPYDRVIRSMYYKTDFLWYKGDFQCLYPGDTYPACSD
jgi:hypothetical protein